MTETGMTPGARTYDEFVELYRRRKEELGLTDALVDYLTGLQNGYTAKLLGPALTKTISMQTMPLLNEVLAVKIVLVEDTEMRARMESRWEKRLRPIFKLKRFSMAALARFAPDVLREIGRRGGAASGAKRKQNLSAFQRRQIARLGADARWGKLRPKRYARKPKPSNI